MVNQYKVKKKKTTTKNSSSNTFLQAGVVYFKTPSLLEEIDSVSYTRLF